MKSADRSSIGFLLLQNFPLPENPKKANLKIFFFLFCLFKYMGKISSSWGSSKNIEIQTKETSCLCTQYYLKYPNDNQMLLSNPRICLHRYIYIYSIKFCMHHLISTSQQSWEVAKASLGPFHRWWNWDRETRGLIKGQMQIAESELELTCPCLTQV